MKNHIINDESVAVTLLFGDQYFDDYNETVILNGLEQIAFNDDLARNVIYFFQANSMAACNRAH